jgi:hypothetical protein
MEFVTKSDLDALCKAANNVGLHIRGGDKRLAFDLLSGFDHFIMTACGDQVKGEAVALTTTGVFLCVMLDTRDPRPVSWAQQNFHNYPETDLAPMSELLETMRVAFFQTQTKTAQVA